MSKFARFYPARKGTLAFGFEVIRNRSSLFFKGLPGNHRTWIWMGTPNGQPPRSVWKIHYLSHALSYQFSWLNLQLLGGPNPRFLFWRLEASTGCLQMGVSKWVIPPFHGKKKQIHWYTVGFGSYIYIYIIILYIYISLYYIYYIYI